MIKAAMTCWLLAGWVRAGANNSAFLYVDPGAGALAWQLLLASVFGALFYARSCVLKIKGRFAGKRKIKRVKGKDAHSREQAAPGGSVKPPDSAEGANSDGLVPRS